MRRALELPVYLFVFLAAPPALCQSQWADWTDETPLRLAGAASMTTSDTAEKTLCVADFDRDGDEDLVVARKTPFFNAGALPDVLFLNENGVLVDRTNDLAADLFTPSDSWDAYAVDVDGDEWVDLVLACGFGEAPRILMNQGEQPGFPGIWSGLSWTRNDGRLPSFQPPPHFAAVSSGDIDRDGDEDLFFSDFHNNLEDRLLINDGQGFFTDETATRLSPEAARSLFGSGSAICDFTGDTWPDILKSSGAFEPVRLLKNDGAGGFTDVQGFPGTSPVGIAAGDFDNDGLMDFYVVDDKQDYLFRNTGEFDKDGLLVTTRFPVETSPRTTGFGGRARLADVDRDGFLDVGVADAEVVYAGCEQTFAVLRNELLATGSPGVADPNDTGTSPWNTDGVFDLAWMDIDGDGNKDLVQGSCSGLSVWLMIAPSMPGLVYCAAAPNSQGPGAHLSAFGSVSMLANDFRLVVDGGVPGEVGLFFFGSGQTLAPFGDGFRCVSNVNDRIFPPSTMSDEDGLVSRLLDLFQYPDISAGSTQNFQFWYRDPGGPLASSFNLSDAVNVTFTP